MTLRTLYPPRFSLFFLFFSLLQIVAERLLHLFNIKRDQTLCLAKPKVSLCSRYVSARTL
jgi:hypothetical protein